MHQALATKQLPAAALAQPQAWRQAQVRWLRRPSRQANSTHAALLNDLPAAQGWPWVEVVQSAAGTERFDHAVFFGEAFDHAFDAFHFFAGLGAGQDGGEELALFFEVVLEDGLAKKGQ